MYISDLPLEPHDNINSCSNMLTRNPKSSMMICPQKNNSMSKKDYEERYLSYVFLRQSVKQEKKLKADIQNKFTTCNDRMTKKKLTTLHLLENYTKNPVVKQPTSEGLPLSQKGDRNKKNEHFVKQIWKDKKCYNCTKTGTPSSHFWNNFKETRDEKQYEKK